MSWLEIGIMYLSGFISGLIAMSGVVLYIGNKHLKSKKKESGDLANELKKLTKQLGAEDPTYAAIETRMLRIKEIAQLQMELQGAADGPQRNAMDGKYKNSLMRTLKELEEEKITILNSIVKDGHDPSVNVLKADGTTEITKLSAFLAGYSSDITDEKNDAAVKQVGKFTVLRGGKDDGGTPTTH